MADYVLVNSDIVSATLKLEYTSEIVGSLDQIYTEVMTWEREYETIYCFSSLGEPPDWLLPTTQSVIEQEWFTGWKVNVIPSVEECYIDFEFSEPVNIIRILAHGSRHELDSYTADCLWATYNASVVSTTKYSLFGNFKIQGRDSVSASWIDLYSGGVTESPSAHLTVFMTGNTGYYTYYRILILNNDGLVRLSSWISQNKDWDKNYYAITGLAFYRSSESYTPPPIDPPPDIYIQAPTNTSPAYGDTGVESTFTLSAGSFECVNGTDTHESTDWQIAIDSFITPLWQSVADTTNLESISVSSWNLEEGTKYYWRCKYTGVTYDSSAWSAITYFTMASEPPPIDPPPDPDPPPDTYTQTSTNVSPTNGATGISQTPVLSAGSFECVNGTDTHESTDWQIAIDSAFTTLLWQSVADTTNLESISVASWNLNEETEYYWRCKYTGVTYGSSAWSTTTSFTTATEPPPVDPPPDPDPDPDPDPEPEPPEEGMEVTAPSVLYTFDNDISCRKIYIQGIQQVNIEGSSFDTFYDTDTDVEGSIIISRYDTVNTLYADVNESGVSTDYHTTFSSSATVSGVATIDGVTIISIDSLILPNGRMDVTGNTVVSGGYIYATLEGQVNIEYDDIDYNISTDITYLTVVSGEIGTDFTGNIPVTGYTNRQESRTSSHRASGFKIGVTDIEGVGSIPEGTPLYIWAQKDNLEDVRFSTHDSITFEITQGEAYDCRLTAWDDVTHSTTLNYLISGDYVRVSALAFRAEGTVLAPESSTIVNNYIASPVYNRIFKGNVVYNGTNYYYGDFDLSHRTEPDMIGDYLIFKPMLYGVDNSIPYGIHDHVIVLHYTYT